ncbi:MAG: CoB--CoM heterodisulfide reductase iron-sulfur subunit A family protein [Alphaproteobacteria bacterium]|nr:CoB--CoM heterodisulfide reductase iron-sulfur subunit A family protein [Alphaproteobacteria bacterium]
MSDKPKSQTVLVVGGGIGGISAALEAAECGAEVVLIEKAPTLGGRVAALNRYFPKMCHPTCGLEINYQRIKKNPRIKVFTMAEVSGISGSKGDYTVTVTTTPRHVTPACTACGDCAKVAASEVADPFNYGLAKMKAAYLPHAMAFPMRYVVDPSVVGTPEGQAIKAACKVEAINLDEKPESFALQVGAVIWATGWKPYDPKNLTMYRHGEIADVITNVEMERLASHDGPTKGHILKPSSGEAPKKVALIQCAGSRDLNHLAYCSRICCLASMKHAAYVREQYPEAEVDIYYIDIRAHDKLEAFYQKAKADPGIRWIKSKPSRIEKGASGEPVVCGENTLSREVYANAYDLVVLATGMQASAQPPAGAQLDDYGFVVSEEGVFGAGVATGPLDVSMSVQSATAAALRAVQAVRS